VSLPPLNTLYEERGWLRRKKNNKLAAYPNEDGWFVVKLNGEEYRQYLLIQKLRTEAESLVAQEKVV